MVAALALSVGFLFGCSASGGENISAGMELIAALEYDNALVSFQTAREAKEDERLILRGEGLAYMGKTMYQEASQSFEQALAKSDGKIVDMDYDINYYLATAYYKLGEKDKAAAVYDAITALKVDARDAYYLRGVIRTEQGKLDAAKEDFDRTISLNGKDYEKPAMMAVTRQFWCWERPMKFLEIIIMPSVSITVIWTVGRRIPKSITS